MDNPKVESRRRFLRLAATAGPAAIAMTIAPTAAAEVVDTPKKSRGMRDTEHTRKYLESARF